MPEARCQIVSNKGLVQEICVRTGFDKTTAEHFILALADTIGDYLCEERGVRILDLGTLKLTKRPRKRRSRIDTESQTIDEIYFSPSVTLKKKLLSTTVLSQESASD